MKKVCATIVIMSFLLTEANAQVIQDNFFGDNVIQQNIVTRPTVRKVIKRSSGGNVTNNYTIIENNVPPAPMIVTPPPVIVAPPPVYYAPVPMYPYPYPYPFYY